MIIDCCSGPPCPCLVYMRTQQVGLLCRLLQSGLGRWHPRVRADLINVADVFSKVAIYT